MAEPELFQKLKNVLTSQGRTIGDIDQIRNAYEFAYKHHDGQLRASDDPYIIHPVEVSIILAELQSDNETLIAGLLHDCLEDTSATEEEIQQIFGSQVLNLVKGVTKLSKFSFSSREQRQAENFRKMFLAMADDVRVILLKLADRLHNMRTLTYMIPEKQKEIAKETMEIFSPLANRLGMNVLKGELDDLSLFYLHPEKYKEISELLIKGKNEFEDGINLTIQKLKELLDNDKINADVYGRAKNYYSIYNKMVLQNKSFQELYDISAVRVLVSTEKDCYQVFGIIHQAFKPMPGRFKDYIAMPKSNLYRSLHTTVIGPTGKPVEIQIRTHEMHQVNEFGIAAHWKYKETGSSKQYSEMDRKFSWLRKLVEFQQDVKDAQEYVDSVKLDLFRDEVFVFSPKGDVHDLPSGAVPIDFAYRVHTQIGNTCTGALVNGKMVPINTPLKSGDIVEIITNKNAHPRLDWLSFVTTNAAKSRIRAWFKKHHREEHLVQGKVLLEAELSKAKLDEIIKSGKLLEIAKKLNYNAIEDLFAAIGYGEINTPKITNRLKKEEKKSEKEELIVKPRYASGKLGETEKKLEGLEGMLYHISKCCFPLPGENIVGVITRSRGISVHREDCKSLSKVDPERLMNVKWSDKSMLGEFKTYPVSFVVQAIDRIGIFKDILAKIADLNINVSYASVKGKIENTAIIELSTDVGSKNDYDKLISTLYDLSDVITIRRQQVGGARIQTKSQKKVGKNKKSAKKQPPKDKV